MWFRDFERMRCSGRYQRMMEFLSATSSRLLAANVILRVWAGSGRLAGRRGHWQVLFSLGRLSSEGAARPWSNPCDPFFPTLIPSPHRCASPPQL
jgi:hypothetical protein